MSLSRTSIKKKLYFTMGFMSFLGILQIIILWFTISTLSAVRAYVGGEALWSKSQKDAIYHLQEYGQNKNREDYVAFLEQIKVPIGDRISRIELEKEHPDFYIATQGFLQGRNHPDDVPGLINTFIRFRHVYYIDRSIQIWDRADSYMDSLIKVGRELDAVIISNPESQSKIQSLMAELHPINLELTRLEDDFTYTLGEGSRWLSNLVMKLLIGFTLTIALICLMLIFFINKSIEKDLFSLTLTTKDIARGEFASQPKIYSNHEIGLLANSINYMSGELKRNIQEREEAQETLKKAKETAERLLQIQEQFLANTSHELRTPINGVIGMTRHLKETPLSQEQEDFVGAITESSNNLLHVVNDILDISKIRAGKIVFEKNEFRLADLFKTLQFTLQYKAKEKNIYLKNVIDTKLPPILVGDSVRLNQILLNLAGNAIKFTEKGGVTVEAEMLTIENSQVTIRFKIADTGIGIPEDKLDYIFETFAQAETHTTRKYGGTGLGLNIAQSLIEQQGGKINVASKVNQGSEFSFSLTFEIGNPLWKEKETLLTEEIPANIDLSDVSVLLIEDNTINQRVVLLSLNKWNVKADVADNAAMGFKKLKEKSYNLILMDVSMPGMDGLEATRFIRSQFPEPIKSIPIIAMTASALLGEKEKCFTAGMNDYISKPFKPITLYSKIVKWTKGEEASSAKEPIEPVVHEVVEVKKKEKLIDMTLLREHSSGEEAFINEISSIYIQAMPEYLTELNRCRDEKNWIELRKTAHKMKSPAAYVGVIELKNVLCEVEQEALKEADVDENVLNKLIDKINDFCVRSIEELKTIAAKPKDK